jgi:hypothetical protein
MIAILSHADRPIASSAKFHLWMSQRNRIDGGALMVSFGCKQASIWMASWKDSEIWRNIRRPLPCVCMPAKIPGASLIGSLYDEVVERAGAFESYESARGSVAGKRTNKNVVVVSVDRPAKRIVLNAQCAEGRQHHTCAC